MIKVCEVCGGSLILEDYQELGICKTCLLETGEVRDKDPDEIEKELLRNIED